MTSQPRFSVQIVQLLAPIRAGVIDRDIGSKPESKFTFLFAGGGGRVICSIRSE
jgi:hypothetical protein